MLRRILLCMALAAATVPAGAQIVSGTVINSTTRLPVAGAMVVITAAEDSTDRQITNTDARGEFLLAGLKQGEYSLLIRRIGYGAILIPSRVLKQGETWSNDYEMTPLATTLDTLRTRADAAKSDLTPGSQWYLKHFRAGKGVFTSGHEILTSGLSSCDYFARVPGLRISRVTPAYEDFGGIRCDNDRFVVMDNAEYSCLRSYVDRIWTISQLDSSELRVRSRESDFLARKMRNTPGLVPTSNDTVPRYVPLTQIAGVELFRNLNEVPKDAGIPAYREPDPMYQKILPGGKASISPPPTTRLPPRDCGVLIVWTFRAW